MEYRQLGLSDLKVSEVGLGTWAIGSEFYGKTDDQESIRTIRAAIDSGINLIDTAPAYGNGHAEEVVGRAIEGRRDEIVLATKVGVKRKGKQFPRDLRPESIRQEIDDSLRRLNVDVIDLYQIHWPDPDTPIEVALGELLKIQETGKFRYLGVSNFKTDLLKTSLEVANIVSLQPQYSLLRRKIEGQLLPFCREQDIGVLSYGTLAGGILTGKFRELPELDEDDRRAEFYDFFREPVWSKVQQLLDVLREIASARDVPVPQVAINWAAQQPGITSALVGAKTVAQAKSNACAGGWQLSDEELKRIRKGFQEYMT